MMMMISIPLMRRKKLQFLHIFDIFNGKIQKMPPFPRPLTPLLGSRKVYTTSAVKFKIVRKREKIVSKYVYVDQHISQIEKIS